MSYQQAVHVYNVIRDKVEKDTKFNSKYMQLDFNVKKQKKRKKVKRREQSRNTKQSMMLWYCKANT